jgi:hypothetical protein
MRRRQELIKENLAVLKQRSHQSLVGAGVRTQNSASFLGGAMEQNGRSIVERVRDRCRRIDPLEPLLGERKAAEEWRSDSEGMNR